MADYKKLFDLQILFARRVSQVTGEPWARILGEYTTFQHHTGLSQKRADPSGPSTRRSRANGSLRTGWNELCAELDRAPDPAALVFQAFERHNDASGPWPTPASCFSYDYNESTLKVRVHFSSADRSGHSPLSDARLPARLAELKTLFTSIKAEHPRAQTLWGSSWINGLRIYVRLFPPEYSGSATIDRSTYSGMGIWGQFFDHRGRVKPHRAETFRRKLDAASTLDDVIRAFRYERQYAECAIERCYEHYGIL